MVKEEYITEELKERIEAFNLSMSGKRYAIEHLDKESMASEEYKKAYADLRNDYLSLYREYSQIPDIDLYHYYMGRNPRAFDVWSISGNDERYGSPEFRGKIASEIVFNCIYWFTNKFDRVVDPMAGGGVVHDVCKAMVRRVKSYDISPTRPDIRQWDIRDGYPSDVVNEDFIFLDPPYYKKIDYGEQGNEFSKDKITFLRNILNLAVNSYSVLKSGGYLAFIMSNYVDYEDNNRSIYMPEMINSFTKCGFDIYRMIYCQNQSSQYRGFHVKHTLDNRDKHRFLTLQKTLVIFKK
ncbi:MAG: hypothetical protein PHQ86_06925 [Dehalococcoidales bacterium]|nr:hypothetical protein [Dehalococcoidales bacterium]